MDQTIGKRLATARKCRGKSQDKLAHELEIATATVSRYETGAITLSVEKARTFADHLGVSLDWLIKGEGDPPKPSGDAQPASAA